MALVDTGPLTIAVDRSLFGPQGRRWIEHKLPYVVSNVTFILVSGFGACLLMFTVCADYQRGGLLRGAAALPKHLANAAVLHLVARLLRWHIGRTVYRAFAPADDRPNVFTRFAMAAAAASAGGSRPSTAARDDDNNAGVVGVFGGWLYL
eukprot:TRINITY_DN14152_c0_g1_i1.p1 TRINITY_DN14152_c0_g1~~TRINITY_DN14152_c0_g1_i1.p1  ORF type:complete len:150 (-),score=48.07 TRINITY_DN14152_c0_g1_i1:291-740(-)